MIIKLDVKQTVEVEAKYVTLSAKVCDQGMYRLLDANGRQIAEREDDYVPNAVIPGSSGDYIELKIDLETGQIADWNPPTAAAIQDAFFGDDA